MRLGDLVEERVESLADFLSRPHPALMLLGTPPPASQQTYVAPTRRIVEEPANLSETVSDDDLDLVQKTKQAHDAITASLQAVSPDAQVEWLVQSGRSSFPGLVSVGRGRDNDIIFTHAGVSKVHADLSKLDGVWWVTDRRSRNGTLLNGASLEANKKRELHDGATLGFGNELTARFLLPATLWSYCRNLGER